jgi:hypothetical protein
MWCTSHALHLRRSRAYRCVHYLDLSTLAHVVIHADPLGVFVSISANSSSGRITCSTAISREADWKASGSRAVHRERGSRAAWRQDLGSGCRKASGPAV